MIIIPIVNYVNTVGETVPVQDEIKSPHVFTVDNRLINLCFEARKRAR